MHASLISTLIVASLLLGCDLDRSTYTSGISDPKSLVIIPETVNNSSPAQGFAISFLRITDTEVDLSWEDETLSGLKAISYDVLLNDKIFIENSTNNYIQVKDLIPETSYNIQVVAKKPRGKTVTSSINIQTSPTAGIANPKITASILAYLSPK